LDEAYGAHPERFVKGRPIAPNTPNQVWINPPQSATVTGAAPAEARFGTAVTVVTGPTKTDNGTHMAVDDEMLRPAEKEKYSAPIPKKCSLFPSGELSQKA